MAGTILIVDDEPVQRRLLEAVVLKTGHDCITADGGEAALEIINGPDRARIALIVLDLVMPDLDGMGVLARMREQSINVPVIVQTAQGGIDTAVNAMRAGAFDFVVKPVSPERLQVSIKNAMRLDALEGEINRIQKQAAGTLTFDDIVTKSGAMDRVIDLGKRAATSNIPILVEGESGVGKELIARAIQGTSNRKSKPFITVNCGAIPENLVESILFGHEKGAFTGANEKHIGKFQEANGGTLFLDEIGELPLDIQVKLLRALQENEVDPIGSKRPVKTDFRLISATNQNLIELVKKGAFREDLYYRLNVFPVWIPPLRERPDDIPELVRHFTARIAIEEGRKNIRGVNPAAMQMLCAYSWPGNIRQLENTIFRAVILCDGDELTINDFPQVAAQMPGFQTSPEPAAATDHATAFAAPANNQPPAFSEAHPAPTAFQQAANTQDNGGQTNHFGLMPMIDDQGNVRSFEEMEGEMIRFAIDHLGGRMTQVARSLGIGRSTLYRKLKELGIDQSSDE